MNNSDDSQLSFIKAVALQESMQKISSKLITPSYLFDRQEVIDSIRRFKNAFEFYDLKPQIFYAVKSNPYVGLIDTVIKQGCSLDVSSQRELQIAIKTKTQNIIYTGPAKTIADFDLIFQYNNIITVNIDSFAELDLLAQLAKKHNLTIRCGIRIVTAIQKGWTKFGIPLDSLKRFVDRAKKYKNINLCGIHFHISLNKNPQKYVQTLKLLADYCKINFSKSIREKFKFIDIGGGFYPQSSKGVYPWNQRQIMDDDLLDNNLTKIMEDKINPRFIPLFVEPIEDFARDIALVWNDHIVPLFPNVKIYCEPGRFIAHGAMHILLKVVDLKNAQTAIVDGGINMLGWEKFQYYNYVPTFNLTDLERHNEKPVLLYGSLCTPDDIWGYYCHTEKMRIGDLVLIPFQGAYSYTLAQNFIKDIPAVYELN